MTVYKSLVATGDAPALFVLLDEMRAHCRIDGTDDEALMTSYLKGAHNYCAGLLGTSFGVQAWRVKYEDSALVSNKDKRDAVILLPRRPVLATPAPVLKYVNTDAEVTTLAADGFQFDADSGELAPLAGETWAETQTGALNPFSVEFSTNVGTLDEFKQPIRTLAAFWYDFRVPVMPDDIMNTRTPGGFDNMVINLRWW